MSPTAVTAGFATTFELLAKTDNEAAVDVLAAALDSPRPVIREAALKALLDRRSVAGHKEILRRLDQADDRWKEILQERRGRMGQALRDVLLGTDAGLCTAACQAIVWFREYDLAQFLINVLEDEASPHAPLAAKTLLELADVLYQQLAGPRDYRERRDPQLVRRHLLAVLEQSVARYPRHRRKQVLEAFLVLTSRDNATLKQILLDPFHGSYLALVDVLLRSERGGVIRLLLSFLDDPQPPSAALATLARRSDVRFVGHLLKKVASDPVAMTTQNLKRLEAVPWFDPQEGILAQLDDAGQESAVKLLLASGVKRLEAYKTIEFLALHGTPGGRRAAVAALAVFPGADGNQLALRGLDDPDPLVQAAAIRQLRQRNIPGALPRLIERADSPHEVVREAVRDSLAEFQFQRFLLSFDMLENEVRRSTGTLVKKIDPQAIPQLVDEMRSPSRSRRLRSIDLTVAMDAVAEVEPHLLRLLRDEDHLVRVEAARALAAGDSQAICTALREALLDPSAPVQEAARRALQEIAHRAGMRARPGKEKTYG